MQLEAIDKLLHSLISALVMNERGIEIDCLPGVHRVRWKIRVTLDDHGMLVGKRGAHVKAINYLVAMIGAKAAQRFDIWAEEPYDIGRAPEDRARPTPPEVFDPTEATCLMQEVLDILCEQSPALTVETRPIKIIDRKDELSPQVIAFFTIRPLTHDDMDTIRGEHGSRPEDRMSTEAAIGTLWRAMGKRVGVEFTVSVV